MYGIPHIKLSKANKPSRGIMISIFLLMLLTPTLPVNAQQPRINRTDITIELTDIITTEAQITYPAIGEGPFPIVLLVPGGGLTDMDEYIPASHTTTEEPAYPMRQIAEYLSERGFMVLRYDKRGVKRNATMINYEVYSQATIDTFKADAEKALSVLRSNPMADNTDITLIGHSESSFIVTRMALDDPDVTKIVMLGACARNYLDIKHTQIVELRQEFAETVMDLDGDMMVSLSEAEASMEPYVNAVIPKNSLLMSVDNETRWIPTWDPDGDGNMSIEDEFLPVLERLYSLLTDPSYLGYNQTQAHISWGATMDIINDLDSSILVLQGENDYQTPLIEALVLEQALVDADHPDHTLYTYPGLGHFFHLGDEWQASMGPVEEYVLSDLYQWLVSPLRGIDDLSELEQNNREAIDELDRSVNESLQLIQNEIDMEREGGTDYVIPVITVLLVLLITTLRKRRD
jgi:hypothetical protein